MENLNLPFPVSFRHHRFRQFNWLPVLKSAPKPSSHSQFPSKLIFTPPFLKRKYHKKLNIYSSIFNFIGFFQKKKTHIKVIF
jgi:hypothetical protein